jgi:NADH-quinone oxidoreductase subunit D
MPSPTVELEIPDALTKASQSLDEPTQDILGEKLIINMGPSHPATHGVLRLVLEMDGEQITKATPDVGYLHRGDEKIAENMQYNQFVPYTDRLDYIAPIANNVAYAMACRKAYGLDAPAARPGASRHLLRARAHLVASPRRRLLRDGLRCDDDLSLHLHRAGEGL